jgi:hypothetical protein
MLGVILSWVFEFILNNIIRLLCAWGVFCFFSRGWYIAAAFLFLGAITCDCNKDKDTHEEGVLDFKSIVCTKTKQQ